MKQQTRSHETAAPIPSASPYDAHVRACRPGPWGELQYSKILLEPPDDLTATDYSAKEIVWFFKNHTDSDLAQLWSAAGLSPAEQQELAADVRIERRGRDVLIRPAPASVLALSTSARTVIYSTLSQYPENPNQAEPFRFRADTADEWFEASALSPDTLRLMKPLLYRRGTSLLFSDADVLLPQIPSQHQRVALIKTLARKSSLMVKLLVKPGADLEQLAAYWERGSRRKALLPLLRSVSHRERGITVDIVHLLPRFARTHLFTYPQASDFPDDANHDCHWSSLNFFNDPPDEKYADTAVVKHTLENEYFLLTDQAPLLGDIVVLQRGDGAVIHSCVFVADDIVFTKNGSSGSMPWLLMALRDVVAFYPSDPPVTTQVYRRKDL